MPPYQLAGIALVAVAVGMAITGLERSVAGLMVGAAIMAVGVAFLTPAFFAAMMAHVRPAERGAAFGTVSIFLDLAFGGGPVLMGLIVSASDIPVAFLVVAAVPLVGAAGTLIVAKGSRTRVAA
jgi:hypothetical protein